MSVALATLAMYVLAMIVSQVSHVSRASVPFSTHSHVSHVSRASVPFSTHSHVSRDSTQPVTFLN